MTPRTRLALAAAAALLLVLPALAGDLEDAAALREKGKWEEALAKYEKCAAADPKDAAAALGRSESLVALGRYVDAASTLGEAIDANPGDVKLLVARSRGYFLQAQKTSREPEPDDNTVRTYSGDAAKWARRALEADAKSSDAKVLLAKSLRLEPEEKKTEEAWKLLGEVIVADPKHFDAHWEMGLMAWDAANRDRKNKTNWALAEKSFRSAFAADPKSGEAFFYAILAKQWQGAAPASDYVQDYAGAARLLPGDTRPLAKLWPLRNNKGLAEPVYKALKTIEGPKAKAYVLAIEGERALADGKTKSADDLFIQAIDAYPDGEASNELYLSIMDDVFKAPADFDVKQRDKVWTALWKKWPKRFEVPNAAGFWHRGDTGGDRDYKASAEWYERAAEVATESPQVLNDTGLIYYFHLSDNKKAEKHFRAAIKTANDQGIEPGNKGVEQIGFRDALNNLAKLLITEKRWKDLGEFAQDDVPKRFPGREEWLEQGKQ